jgi:hypothetical protein
MILLEAHEGVAGGNHEEKKQLRIFCMQDCGGPPFIRMLKNYVRL